MADNKEQIIKWAKYCEQGNCASNECPYHKYENCCAYLIKDLLTLTEDVVPRSEVEGYIVNMNAYGLTAKRLAEENKSLQAQVNRLKAYDEERDITLHQRLVREAKQDVAKQIFEEIEKNIEKHYNRHIFGVEELSDVEQEAVMNFSDDVSSDLAELKKKYIGE